MKWIDRTLAVDTALEHRVFLEQLMTAMPAFIGNLGPFSVGTPTGVRTGIRAGQVGWMFAATTATCVMVVPYMPLAQEYAQALKTVLTHDHLIRDREVAAGKASRLIRALLADPAYDCELKELHRFRGCERADKHYYADAVDTMLELFLAHFEHLDC